MKYKLDAYWGKCKVGLNPPKTMIIYSILFLLLSNAVTFRREKSTQTIQFLLLLLVTGSFLYFISYYILGWNCFSLHLSFILIVLLRLTDYTSHFYHINKTITTNNAAIKPHSTMYNFREILTDIILYLLTLINLVRSIIILIMSPRNGLLSVVFEKIQSIIIYTFTSSTYYKTLSSTYYKGGLFSLFKELATFIYYDTTCYIQRNLYYMVALQCICLYQTYLGSDFWLIISLVHMTIHLPFFIISILTYITIVNKSFYKQHPLLFSLYTCVCLLLLFVFILLLVVLYSKISHLIDDYFIQAKTSDGNDKGNSSGPGPGPQQDPSGGGPSSDTSYIYPGSDKKKGKGKEKDTGSARIPHVVTVAEEYAQEADKLYQNPELTSNQKCERLFELSQKRIELSSKSSSSYEHGEYLATKKFYMDKINELKTMGLSDDDKRIKYLELLKKDRDADAIYKKKISDVGSSGHSREFQSIDQKSTGYKGIPRDMTAPNLGGFERSQQFEEKPKQPFGFDGTTDYHHPRNKESNLEVPVGQGLEVDNAVKAPEFSTRKEDLQPDSNPAASQMDKSKVDPLSTVYSPPVSPRKRDILKNIFKKGGKGGK